MKHADFANAHPIFIQQCHGAFEIEDAMVIKSSSPKTCLKGLSFNLPEP